MTGKHLKCIGGPWDGRSAMLEPGYRHLTVREHVGMSALQTVPNPVTGPMYTEMRYVIGRVHADGETIEFLHPSDWSAERTLRHALGAA